MFKLLRRRTDNITGLVWRLFKTLEIDLQMIDDVWSAKEFFYSKGTKIFQFGTKLGLESRIWHMIIIKLVKFLHTQFSVSFFMKITKFQCTWFEKSLKVGKFQTREKKLQLSSPGPSLSPSPCPNRPLSWMKVPRKKKDLDIGLTLKSHGPPSHPTPTTHP